MKQFYDKLQTLRLFISLDDNHFKDSLIIKILLFARDKKAYTLSSGLR